MKTPDMGSNLKRDEYLSHKKMATMTNETLQLGLNHIDALESFSVDSQTSRSARNNQNVVRFQ